MIPDAAAAGSFAAIACRARPTRDATRFVERSSARPTSPQTTAACVAPGDLLAGDDEPLRDGDAVLPAGEAVLRVQERPGDQGESERGESEVVAAQAHQRDADHHRDRRR